MAEQDAAVSISVATGAVRHYHRGVAPPRLKSGKLPYDVTIIDKDRYVRVEVAGVRTPGQEAEDGIAVWRQVAEHCRERRMSRILAVVDLSGRLPTLAAYKMGQSPESFGWRRNFKLAVVGANEPSHRDNLFTETVAVNRGYTVRIFDDEQPARDWLLAD